MENKEHQNQIIKLLKVKKNSYGLSLTDIKNELGITKDQVRISISFLLGASKVKEHTYGMSKIYQIMGDKE